MRNIYSFFIVAFFSLQMNAQTYNFETEIPSVFEFPDLGQIMLSVEKAKEGKSSLLWEWSGTSILRITDTKNLNDANNSFSNRGGVTFWIYNEKSRTTPLLIRFVDDANNVCYQFDFNLTYTGWKACWMAFINMKDALGEPAKKVTGVNLTMELVAPEDDEDSRFFIDRFKIFKPLNAQTMPDAQIPENNVVVNGGTPTHWGRLWEWEMLEYDTPLPETVTTAEKADIEKVRQNVKIAYKMSAYDATTLIETLKKEGIGAQGVVGVKPLVTKTDPQYNKVTEYNLTDLTTILYRLSRAWWGSKNEEAKVMFIEVMKWAMDQGFFIGSCMGGNDHYGYEIRNAFIASLWMKEPLREAGILDDVAKTIAYWSGLPETRQPYELERGELADSWNTLLVGRLCAALLYETDAEQLRALRSLYRWIGQSLCITPGTIGGIKPDFSGFHHGGHYPAYSVPGYASVGEVIGFGYDTQFEICQEGKEVFKEALMAVGRYSNQVDWGIGLCGRHPLNPTNQISAKAQLAFAHLARAFTPVDRELASEFLRINQNTNSPFIKEFTDMGVVKSSPSGFFPYNWSCFGVFRNDNWMLSIKGYNKWVWGAEIYTSANRYGRYQSYGSTQIIVGSEIDSRWEQPGWDWNRLPGTTTIHLPFERLNSPSSGTLMQRSTETFSGATELMGKYGMFATKIKEATTPTFTPSFVARKSVFCVANRAVCIGTGIYNKQTNPSYVYPTETTLFQQKLNQDSESFLWDGTHIVEFPYRQEEVTTGVTILSDLTGNFYRIEGGQDVVLLKQEQESRNDETKTVTKGKFATAYINHGIDPNNVDYEYMITVQATEEDKAGMDTKPYIILKKDNIAHIVEDKQEKVVGYALFESYDNSEDRFILSSTGETLIMLQYKETDVLSLSICDPTINIGDDSYTTINLSVPVEKKIILHGKWTLNTPHPQVSLLISEQDDTTVLFVSCVNGFPVNLKLNKQLYTSIYEERSGTILTVEGEMLIISGEEVGKISVYNMQGVCIKHLLKNEKNLKCTLPKGFYIVNMQFSTGCKMCKVLI